MTQVGSKPTQDKPAKKSGGARTKQGRDSAARAGGGSAMGIAPAAPSKLESPPGELVVDQDELHQLVGYSCRRAHAVVHHRAAKCLAAHDLPPGWFTVLMLLSRNPGLSSKQLCAVLGVKPPNFVALVASFEGRGLIERKQHPNDFRSLGLYLTPDGRRLVDRLRKDMLHADREATSMLDADERRTLLTLLKKIYDSAGEAVPLEHDGDAGEPLKAMRRA